MSNVMYHVGVMWAKTVEGGQKGPSQRAFYWGTVYISLLSVRDCKKCCEKGCVFWQHTPLTRYLLVITQSSGTWYKGPALVPRGQASPERILPTAREKKNTLNFLQFHQKTKILRSHFRWLLLYLSGIETQNFSGFLARGTKMTVEVERERAWLVLSPFSSPHLSPSEVWPEAQAASACIFACEEDDVEFTVTEKWFLLVLVQYPTTLILS